MWVVKYDCCPALKSSGFSGSSVYSKIINLRMRHQAGRVEMGVYHIFGDRIPEVAGKRTPKRRDYMVQFDEGL